MTSLIFPRGGVNHLGWSRLVWAGLGWSKKIFALRANGQNAPKKFFALRAKNMRRERLVSPEFFRGGLTIRLFDQPPKIRLVFPKMRN